MAAKTASGEKKAPNQQSAAVVQSGEERKTRTLGQKIFRGGLFSFLALFTIVCVLLMRAIMLLHQYTPDLRLPARRWQCG